MTITIDKNNICNIGNCNVFVKLYKNNKYIDNYKFKYFTCDKSYNFVKFLKIICKKFYYIVIVDHRQNIPSWTILLMIPERKIIILLNIDLSGMHKYSINANMKCDLWNKKKHWRICRTAQVVSVKITVSITY